MSDKNPYDGLLPDEDNKSLVPLDAKNVPADWTAEQRIRYRNHLQGLQTNAQRILALNIPMTCKGEKCAFHNRCPLFQDGVAPIGKPCPIEGSILSNTFAGLCESLNVDPNDHVDVNLARELSQIEVDLNRIAQILAEEGLIQNKCVGLVDGQPVYQEDEHVLLKTQDRLRKRKEKIMQLLNSTRKDKAANKVDITFNSAESFIEQLMKNAKPGSKFIDIDPSDF